MFVAFNKVWVNEFWDVDSLFWPVILGLSVTTTHVYVVPFGMISELLFELNVNGLPLHTLADVLAIEGVGLILALIRKGSTVQLPVTLDDGVTTYLTVIGELVELTNDWLKLFCCVVGLVIPEMPV